jgi:hypothetical protein
MNEADFFFAIQLDETTDITGEVHLLAFSRPVCNRDITKKYAFRKPLAETTKNQYILNVVVSYFSSHDLSRKSCIRVCTGGAP